MKLKTRRLLIVVDISESAADEWDRIQSCVTQILNGLSPNTLPEVALLGTQYSYSKEEWINHPTLPIKIGSAPSLIAPVMASIREHIDEIVSIMILGSGEIFDLPDWLRNPEVWFPVQLGGNALTRGESLAVQRSPAEIDKILGLVENTRPGKISWPNHSLSGSVAQDWSLDRCGYPMIYVSPLRAYMHLFPIMRAQFEVYLSNARPAEWHDSGWERRQEMVISRIPPHLATSEDYEGAFLGGTIPDDIAAFQTWNGNGYRPLSEKEWLTAWKWLEGQTLCVPPPYLEDGLEPSAREFWGFALENSNAQSLLDITFMRNGMVEWVKTSSGEWGGMGKPRQIHPFHNPLTDPMLKPTSLTRRSKWLGFRLIRKAS